jgi:hypothetical protein
MLPLTNKQKKRLEKLANVLDGGEIAIVKEISEIEERLEEIVALIPTIEQPVKGDKGDKGDRGIAGKNGKDGRDGKNGRDGFDGKDGADGFIDDATIAYLEDKITKVQDYVKARPTKHSDGLGLVVRQLQAGRNISIDGNQEYPTITNTNPKITVSETAPTSPQTGDLWIDTNAYTYRAVTTTYTITSEDYFLDCSGTFTITLPTAVSFSGEYIIKNTSNGIITVATTSSQTIDGVTTFQLIEDEVITLRSTNSNWLIV